VVKPVHAKAIPVILSTPDEWDVWLRAPIKEALQLQRPMPEDALRVVASGARSD
jgi:putative SOS response-associated peptidase YedK